MKDKICIIMADGKEDVEIFAKRFPNAKIEKLIYIDKDGKQYRFIEGQWKEYSSK